MRVRRALTGRLTAVLALVVLGHAPARGDEVYGWDVVTEAREVAQASQGFLDAFRKSDQATMTRIASARTPDALQIVGGLLGSHARVSLETPAEPGDYLQAARAYVALAQANPAAQGAAELLAARERYGAQDLEREARFKTTYRALARTDKLEDGEADLAKIAERDADLAGARASFSACNLWVERGRCLRLLRRDEEALRAAEGARAAAEAVPWPLGAARARRLEALVCLRLGDMERAAEVTRAIARIHRDLGDRALASRAERRVSSILRRAAHYDAALAAAKVAAEDARAAGRDDLLGHALLAESTVRGPRGEGAEAVRLATEAAALFRKAGDADGEANAWSTLATEHVLHDRFADALLAGDRAAEALGRTSGAVLATFTWTNLGIVHRRLGRLDLALEDQRRALGEAERSGQPGLVGLARGNLGLVEADLGLPTFRATLEQALAEKRAAGDREGALETELALGGHLARDPATAAAGKQRLESAVAEARGLKDPFRLAVALDALATAAERHGDLAGGLALAAESAGIYANLDERSMRAARVQELIARLELASGAPDKALAASLRAVALRRTGFAGLSEEDAAALGGVVRRASEVGLEAALARMQASPEAAAAAAFELAEGARAALLTAGIVQSEAFLATQVPEAALAAEAASRARVEAARARLVESLHAPTAKRTAVMASARKDLDLAWGAHEQAVARIRREETRAAGVAFPAIVSLTAFQATLPPTAAYVGYQVTPQRLVALVVTREKAVLRALGPSEGLAARVEGWLRLASTPGADDTGPAALLYDALVRPLEADIAGRTALVVAPDGPLAFAPLEALLRTGEPKPERLLARWTVSYVPSATVLAALRAESAKAGPAAGFLGLGNPDYESRPGEPSAAPPGLAPLPASAAEVRDVAAVYPASTRTILLGDKASRAGLLAALAARPTRLRALHLATHAFLDPERPRRSCLVLAGGDVLDVDAIHRLRVPADLAVLSACATARGALVAGEGVSGLARGFFIAGVPRVVVSAWVVSDASAAPVLVAFHRGVEAQKQPYAASLRAAKLAALSRGGAAAHPSAWAAFTLWGLPD